jgi:DNA polymerase-3 subunit delta
LVIDDCRNLPEQAMKELASYLEAPAPDATLILLAEVPERGKLPAGLAKLVKGKATIRQVAVGRRELPKWIQDRAKRKGMAIRPDAANAIVDMLGESPAILDAALEQLKDAFPAERITRELVASQFQGLGEQRMWDLCDRAFGKDLPGTSRSLASLLESREDPLAILGGIASRLRDLLRVKSLPQGTSPAEAADRAGLRYEWQGRRYLEQARRFSMDDLLRLHEQVAEADRAMKSGAPGDVVLPVVVAAVAGGGEEYV